MGFAKIICHHIEYREEGVRIHHSLASFLDGLEANYRLWMPSLAIVSFTIHTKRYNGGGTAGKPSSQSAEKPAAKKPAAEKRTSSKSESSSSKGYSASSSSNPNPVPVSGPCETIANNTLDRPEVCKAGNDLVVTSGTLGVPLMSGLTRTS